MRVFPFWKPAAWLASDGLYDAIALGELKARKFGKRTLILRADLQAFLANLPVVGTDA